MSTTTKPSDKAEPVVLPVDLRDYFAAKALAGYISRGTMYDSKTVAKRVYELADAMLAARTHQVQHGVAVTTFDKFLADESPEFRAAVDNRYQELRGEAQPQEEDECPHCVNGITPMTMDRPCRHCTPTLHTHTQEGRG